MPTDFNVKEIADLVERGGNKGYLVVFSQITATKVSPWLYVASFALKTISIWGTIGGGSPSMIVEVTDDPSNGVITSYPTSPIATSPNKILISDYWPYIRLNFNPGTGSPSISASFSGRALT